MRARTPLTAALVAVSLLTLALPSAFAASPKYDITTLAGKAASLHGTAGLQVRFSAFLEEEATGAENQTPPPGPTTPITPSFVLSSPLDGTSIAGPNVLVNQDTAGAPQNETSIAVDPNNPNRVVASANDYVTRTWTCTINGTPCSALGDGYSGTYYSNDGGQTWCCASSDPAHLGTLIPGVTRLAGGVYDAAGDPAVAFDSRGHVFYAGLGFNRASAPNTVAVNKGTFDGSGHLSWAAPVFINPTTAPSTLNDKEWIAVDSHASSQFRDNVYVTWTRFKFNGHTGAYTQSPIFFVRSTDGGVTYSAPKAISANILYSQGSRPVVGPDGTLYVFWDGSTRLASLNSTWMVKSTDGGATFSKPVAISRLTDTDVLKNTAFRVNSFPAAAAAPNGDLYATWTTEALTSGTPNLAGETACADWLGGNPEACYSVAVYSKSTNGGSTWSSPAPVFAPANRTAIGYPVTQPNGDTFGAPAALPAEQVFPAVAVAPNGRVYLSAYSADVVSPWQTCDAGPPPPPGRIACDTLGSYIHNARLNYKVADLTTGVTRNVNTHPINTRHGFGGGFFGDYTDIAVGSDNVFHALWTDSNNRQTVVWFYGFEFTPTSINQEEIVTATGSF
ncbi:MAG TPA: sialidase family protein [Candidatus Limnocylindrales bacterium]|nr:sialidase family protein [Candidatus Limnocylindrales bacterium]